MGPADQERLRRLGRALEGCGDAWGDALWSMYSSKWWRTVPVYEEPKPVSGEIEWK